MNRIESRGVRCLECAGLDLQGNPELAKAGTGRCLNAMAPHFVSILMSRNCVPFEQAPPEQVQARDRWASAIKMFWER